MKYLTAILLLPLFSYCQSTSSMIEAGLVYSSPKAFGINLSRVWVEENIVGGYGIECLVIRKQTVNERNEVIQTNDPFPVGSVHLQIARPLGAFYLGFTTAWVFTYRSAYAEGRAGLQMGRAGLQMSYRLHGGDMMRADGGYLSVKYRFGGD